MKYNNYIHEVIDDSVKSVVTPEFVDEPRCGSRAAGTMGDRMAAEQTTGQWDHLHDTGGGR